MTNCLIASTGGGHDKDLVHDERTDLPDGKAKKPASSGVICDKTVEIVRVYGPEETATVDIPEEVPVKRAENVKLGDVASSLFVRVSRGTPKNHEECGDKPKESANNPQRANRTEVLRKEVYARRHIVRDGVDLCIGRLDFLD